MRKLRTAQISLFETYAKHEVGVKLSTLSSLLDAHQDILVLLAADLMDASCKDTGCCGMTVESVFRCLLLKQQLKVSYEQLSFLLSDSMSYRTFARLGSLSPKKSSLQRAIRRIRPETLEAVHQRLMQAWLSDKAVVCDSLRMDSTVVKSTIAPPSAFLLARCRHRT